MKKSPRRKSAMVAEHATPYQPTTPTTRYRFLEFFAGGGMARAGLSPYWESVWANDFSPEKAFVYQRNWGYSDLHVGDVAEVKAVHLPDADLAWGSFPCQDLSLAGQQIGIGKDEDKDHIRSRSGSFWPFWRLVVKKRPTLVVLENVVGALSSNGSRDFHAICAALTDAGYSYGPMVIDATHWVPQSRPRLFIVGIQKDHSVPSSLYQQGPSNLWHTDAVRNAYTSASDSIRKNWIWWDMPAPAKPPPRVETLIDREPNEWVRWDSTEKTNYILNLMTPAHLEKVQKAQMLGRRIVGFAYRRTREGRQRAEVRFDGIAGCLRTAGGGSSKQIVVEVTGKQIRTRLLSPREAARLQGLPDNYWLPSSYNDAYDVVGDGLCVPVVNFLGQQILTPLMAAIPPQLRATA